MYLREDEEFLSSIHTGEDTRNSIKAVLESARLLDRLYASAEIRRELEV
jgi:hypothetical protein